MSESFSPPGSDSEGNRCTRPNDRVARAPSSVSVHRRERVFGEFDRTLSLPVQLDSDRIKAEYQDGILALFLPRAEQDKPRTISIK